MKLMPHNTDKLKSPATGAALLRQSLRLFLPAALVFSAMLLWVKQSNDQTRQAIIESRESGYLEVAEQIVNKEFSEIIGDLRVIAGLPMLQRYLRGQDPRAIDELAVLYQLIAGQYGRYDQIRYLDAGGQEIIRINFNDGQPVIVPHAQLQNKAQRYYFQETMALGAGEIYVSPLDLNIESGRLEMPYKPMIRFSTPVFDRDGNRCGAIVLNYLGDKLRQSLHGVLHNNPGHHAMLLNRDGYWLSAEDPNDEWGFMPGTAGQRFAQRFAEEWPTIAASPSGKFRTERGLFLYVTVQPLRDIPNIVAQNPTLGSSWPAQQAADYQWKIVLYFSDEDLAASSFFRQPGGRGLIGLCYFLLAAGSLIIARANGKRRYAERLKSQAAAEIADLYEMAPCGYHSLDANGMVIRINRTELDWLGYRREEVEGRMHITGLLSPASVRLFLVDFPRFHEQGHLRDLELEVRRKDGSLFPVIVNATAVYDKSGRFVQSRSTLTDLTARKRIESALQSKQAELERAQTLGRIGSWIVDARRNTLEWSKETHRILGVPLDVVPSDQTFFDRVHPDDVVSVQTTWQAAMAGQPYELKHRIIVAGEEKWIHEKAEMLFDENGQFAEAFGTMHDITELERTERQLQNLNAQLEARTAEAEAATRSKSVFLANMSHEIRTPMNAVLGLAQLLEREPLLPEHKTLVSLIRGAGRTLLSIIDDILDFSRIEAGQLAIAHQAFDLSEVLAQIDNLQAEAARDKGLSWHVEAIDKPYPLVGDGLRVEQILLNLTGNALKFTERGEVSVRVFLLESKAASITLRFEVRDTGIGITQDNLTRLFAPFTQVESSGNRRYGGSGLGLSICKRLVELMHGRLGVDSVFGQGSLFWFELPFETATATAAAKPETTQPTMPNPRLLAGRHILVIDDSQTNREIVSRVLASAGARVTPADDGRQALDLLQAPDNSVDAVLMDMQMPVMDGFTATRAIRKQLGLSELPVIAFSASVFHEEQQAMLAAGVNQVISKPADLDELVVALSRWLPASAASNPLKNLPAPELALANTVIHPDNFPSIAGIDRAWAQAQYADDADFFLSILRRFIEEWRDLPARVNADLAIGNHRAAMDSLHKLHGAASLIGARDLADAARGLERAIRGKTADLADLQARLEQLLRSLQANQTTATQDNDSPP